MLKRIVSGKVAPAPGLTIRLKLAAPPGVVLAVPSGPPLAPALPDPPLVPALPDPPLVPALILNPVATTVKLVVTVALV